MICIDFDWHRHQSRKLFDAINAKITGFWNCAVFDEPITKEYVDNNKYQAIDLGISKTVPVFVDRVITFIESAISW